MLAVNRYSSFLSIFGMKNIKLKELLLRNNLARRAGLEGQSTASA
jgi:hypothetical protein